MKGKLKVKDKLVVKAGNMFLCAAISCALALPVGAQQKPAAKAGTKSAPGAKADARSDAKSAPAKADARSEAKAAQAKADGKSDAKAAPAKSDAPNRAVMAGSGKTLPADLEYQGRGVKIMMQGDYFLHEYVSQDGKIFCFKGPEHPDKKTAVFNVSIMPMPKGLDMPGERQMMDSMLAHHKETLKDYKEVKEPTFTSGGHTFKGVSFSGKAKDGENRAGFVYLAQVKDTFFILYGQDEKPFSDKALPLLMAAAKSCQITKAPAGETSSKTAATAPADKAKTKN